MASCWHEEGMTISFIGPILLIGAALFTGALIVLLQPLLRRYALARPNARSSHREPTPQGGGMAVVAATLALTALAVVVSSGLGWTALTALAPLFAATLLLAVVGAVDDIITLEVIPRLLLQGIAVVLVVVALPNELRIVSWLPLVLERALLVLGALWFVNLTNFMDGIDWITVAEVVPVSATLGILGVLGLLPASATLIAFALLGAMIGFAPFNRPVARLFLGDVGSLPIGLLLAWLLLQLAAAGHLVAALLLPLYYLADATITLLRRLTNGERIMQAHRSHFYQRATDNGLTVPQIVARVFATNIVLGGLTLGSVLAGSRIAEIVALAVGCALVAVLLVGFARKRA
jgi:UDP-N-acetylmuramyl pentapeptide phosphotransferase/UDP-N-acetylglucosamine-1-phosphate transferase